MGIVQIRILGEIDDIEETTRLLANIKGLEFGPIDNRLYPNRKGSGARKYINAIVRRTE